MAAADEVVTERKGVAVATERTTGTGVIERMAGTALVTVTETVGETAGETGGGHDLEIAVEDTRFSKKINFRILFSV